MKYITLILSVFILVGCNSTKQAQKQLKKLKNNHSELFDTDTIYTIKTDTLIVEVSKYVFDTIVEITDTVTIETGRFKTVIQVVKDSIPYYIVNTEIKRLEIPIEVTDTVTTIKEAIKWETVYIRYVPWWWWLLLIVAVLLTLYLFVKS